MAVVEPPPEVGLGDGIVEPPQSARPVPRLLVGSAVVLGVAIVAVLASLLFLPARSTGGTGAASTDAATGGVPSGARDWGPAPSFALPALDGRVLGPRHWRGRPLVLAFWASWCAPCREEAPVLVHLAHRYAPAGVAVLGVDVRDSPAAARQFARAHAFSFPVVSDPTGTVAGWYGVAGLPTLALIGRNGHLLVLHPGPLNDASVSSFLAPLGQG